MAHVIQEWAMRGIAFVGLMLACCCAARAESAPAVTAEQIAAITYEECDDDGGRVAPLMSGVEKLRPEEKKRFDVLIEKLKTWKPAAEENVNQRVRNLLCLASFVDVSRSEFEGELAGHIFSTLQTQIEKDVLIKACATIVLHPKADKAVLTAPELGYDWEVDEAALRERSTLYARKLLGRLLGKLPAKK